MAQFKHCDRCKKTVEAPNEIGVVLEISNFVAERGYVRPSKRLLDAAKESGWNEEYLPLVFKKELFGEIDLCADCFKDFMNLKQSQ